jgi:cytochrome c-type biogenesis protein CcmH/NrfF
MKRSSITTIALFLLVTGLSLPQSATTYVTPEIRRVGDQLACKCGSCNNTVATCQMLECHYTAPARQKIAAELKAGKSDQQIIDGFVKEAGIAALAAPPTSGFSLLSYLMPFVAIMFGLAAIMLYWQRFRKRTETAASGAGATPESGATAIDEKYRKQIEAEMSEMD